ncbi:MAG: hypothetical protein O7B98_07595 [Alphaproteobacteria bacterium]|nr:hypothetical protein [Alphaproteobacteria bacterium]
MDPTCQRPLPSVLLGGHRADAHAVAVGPTGRYLEILARPLSAVALSRQNDDWLVVAYKFGAITAFSATIAFYLGMLVRRIG